MVNSFFFWVKKSVVVVVVVVMVLMLLFCFSSDLFFFYVYLRPRCWASLVSVSSSYPGRNYRGPSSPGGVACAPAALFALAHNTWTAPPGPERATGCGVTTHHIDRERQRQDTVGERKREREIERDRGVNIKFRNKEKTNHKERIGEGEKNIKKNQRISVSLYD